MNKTEPSIIDDIPETRSEGFISQSNIKFEVIEQTYWQGVYTNFRNKIFKPQEPISPQITLQQAKLMFRDFKYSDIEAIKQLSFQDFLPYLRSIDKHYLEYRRNIPKYNQKETDDDLDQMIVNCYQKVPSYYFQPDYHFNFTVLCESNKIGPHLEDQQHYLDEVEITLFYHINTKFDQFLSVILQLNSMNGLIESNMKKVKAARIFNKQAKEKLLKKSFAILDKQKNLDTKEDVLKILKKIQKIQLSLQNLQELINSQKYEQASKLLKGIEQTYQKHKNLTCLKNLPQRLNALLNHLQSSLESHILAILLTQITSQIIPSQKLLSLCHTNDHEDSVMANSFVNESFLDQSHQLVPTFKDDHQLTKLVISAVNIIELQSKVYKNKIMEELNSYHQDFILQLKDFLGSQNQELLKFDEKHELELIGQLVDPIQFPVFVKIVSFYSDNLKENDQLVSTQDHEQAIEIAEEHASIPVAMLKFANEKVSALLGLKEQALIAKLRISLIFFKFINIKLLEDLPKNERIIARVKLQLQKCTLNQLIYMRAGQEKQYLQQFHQQKQAQIRKYFENEIWLPSDISYEFNEILNYLFDITQATTENLDESVVLNSSIAIEKAILSQMVVNNIFLITKSEIKMKQNESKFKLTQAFLFYVQVIYQYIRLFENFNTITFDMVQKLFETMNQFNSQQQQLILGAGAVAFGKMKTISAKNLAISSTSLRFFLTILDPISNKLLRIINQFLTEKPDYAESINVASVSVELNKIKTDYFNHNSEIVSKLTSLIQERFQEQFDEIAKQLWNDQLKLITPTKYTSSIIQNTRSLYQAVDEILIQQDLKTIFQSIFGYLKQDYLKTFRNIRQDLKELKMNQNFLQNQYLKQESFKLQQGNNLMKQKRMLKIQQPLKRLYDYIIDNLFYLQRLFIDVPQGKQFIRESSLTSYKRI
ncbi:Vacuolar protein sorting-associated protein 54 [Paramecium bursaria]